MNMDKEDWVVYMKMLKENEEQRLSFNERHKRWNDYLQAKSQRDGPKRSETSFDMNKY